MLVVAATLSAENLVAQALVARSEFICYDKREDAVADVRDNIDKYMPFSPTLQFEDSGKVRAVYEQVVDIPAAWQDFRTYLHMENVGADYAIFVNGEQITEPVDRFTPTEIFLSPYLEQGENTLAVVVVAEEYMEGRHLHPPAEQLGRGAPQKATRICPAE